MTAPDVEPVETPARARVLVTGGSSGLGAALVDAYVARGAQVLNCDLKERRREEDGSTSSTSGVSYLRLDVRSDDDWAAAVAWVDEHWGGLDVLVNNAGVAGGGRIDVATMDEWLWITEINLFGVVRGTRAFTPIFKRQGSGRVINVASLAGLVHPAGMASYNAVKAGVVAFTETVGHELAGYGVTAHVVCPSYFRTGLVDSMQGSDVTVGEVIGALVANSPVGPEEIAQAVLEGVDRGDELILPDDAARGAHQLKVADRAAYDAVMRKQAAHLDAMGGPA